jgi:ABC-type uncharacterized transport system YnjBCD permease subunit
MKKKLPDWIKPGAWGVIIGAVGYAIVAFSSGWIVTSQSAEDMADRQSSSAVLAALTPICVAQFRTAGQIPLHVAALGKEDSWKRGDYVAGQGWATMPGSAEPSHGVADACAEQLMKIGAK